MSDFPTGTANIKSTLNRLVNKLSPSNQQWGRFLKRWHFLNGSWLKILAIVTMTIDHAAALYFWNHPSFHITLLTIGSRTITLYAMMRLIGRLAFPIFSFLLVEGFLHTHNRFKYGCNLFLFALISEIPFNLACSNALFYPSQNVFFTLFLGYLGLCAIEHFKNKLFSATLSLVGLFIISFFLKADYSYIGFGFILMLFALRNSRLIQALVGCCILPSHMIAGLAFIPLSMYNGNRGFIKGSFAKYFFYIYYPLHLLVIYLLR
jgi:hypothetical protein